MPTIHNAVAEVIVLDDRVTIKVLTEHGYLIGYYPTIEAMARDIDIATLTVKE